MSSGAGQTSSPAVETLTPEQTAYIVPSEKELDVFGDPSGHTDPPTYSNNAPDPHLHEHKFAFKRGVVVITFYPNDNEGHRPNFNVTLVSGWSRTLIFENLGELDLLSKFDSVTYGAFVDFLRGLLLMCKFNPR